jgi:predicted dithiol-disulfide oxidoreductase (DUF899 family)
MARSLIHSTEFPGETVEYRRARNKLLQAEIKLRRQVEAVAEARRALPLGGRVKQDYTFDSSAPGEKDFKKIRISQLFAPGKRSLFLYNFMFPEAVGSMTPCPSCTSIIDAVDGASRHVVQRINFAIVAKAPIDKFRAHANRRGWRHALLLSSADNTFNRDYGAEDPAVSSFPSHTFSRARQGDQSLLVQRAVVGRVRARAGPAPRRFHVASVEHLRLDARRTRKDLGAAARLFVSSRTWIPSE